MSKIQKALSILGKNPAGMTAKSFAQEWFGSENPIWTRVKNGVSGAGAWLWAGSYLSKLKKKGLVDSKGVRLYVLTPAGRAIISDC